MGGGKNHSRKNVSHQSAHVNCRNIVLRSKRVQFSGMVEPDLTKIRGSMNIQGQPRLREAAKLKAESELKRLERGESIRIGEDIIKSEFKTLNKMSKKELIEQIELSRKNNSDSTVKNPDLGEE